MNILEKYMKSVEESAKANGIKFVDTMKNQKTSNTVKPMSEEEYASKLLKEAMISEPTFKNFERSHNMDWEHIQKVMQVADEKYGSDYLKEARFTSDELRTLKHLLEKAKNNGIDVMLDDE